MDLLSSGGRRPLRPAAATGLLALVSLAAAGTALAGQSSPPDVLRAPASAAVSQPARKVASVPVEAQPPPARSIGRPIRGPVLQRSRLVSVTIPSLDVRSPEVVTLGLDGAGAMEVPGDADLAGWYQHGPTPGEPGPAVLAGHVDSRDPGPGVFFRLGELEAADEVLVGRADGNTAAFAVERVARYRKAAFPTGEVYGDTDHAAPRLITCGGSFDHATGHYTDNVVVFARLTGVRRR